MISAVETKRPSRSGPTCATNLRNPAGPAAIDAATIGRMNESNVAQTQMVAFVAMSFFFEDGAMLFLSKR